MSKCETCKFFLVDDGGQSNPPSFPWACCAKGCWQGNDSLDLIEAVEKVDIFGESAQSESAAIVEYMIVTGKQAQGNEGGLL